MTKYLKFKAEPTQNKLSRKWINSILLNKGVKGEIVYNVWADSKSQCQERTDFLLKILNNLSK